MRVMVVHQLPRNGAGGYGSHGMTQKQCDAYYMNDGKDCPGMNDMYRGGDGYIGRCDSRQRAEGYVDENELSTYPELGLLGVGVSKSMYSVNRVFMPQLLIMEVHGIY